MSNESIKFINEQNISFLHFNLAYPGEGGVDDMPQAMVSMHRDYNLYGQCIIGRASDEIYKQTTTDRIRTILYFLCIRSLYSAMVHVVYMSGRCQ